MLGTGHWLLVADHWLLVTCYLSLVAGYWRNRVSGIRKLEYGLRPIGAYSYAPAGMRKIRKGAGLKAHGARYQWFLQFAIRNLKSEI